LVGKARVTAVGSDPKLVASRVALAEACCNRQGVDAPGTRAPTVCPIKIRAERQGR